ncbi:MAG: hypothetical protein Q8Q97_00145, partial [bacterium]|nr:hypothetical protein [bacterium]
MADSKGQKIPAALIAGIGIAIIVVAAALFYLGPSIGGPNVPPAGSNPPGNNGPGPIIPGPGEPSGTPGEDNSLWLRVSNSLVQDACLSEAKRQAGANSWAVRDCTCSPTEGEDEKSYNCSIGALDGGHPLSIDCFRQKRSCTLVSEQGTSMLTFEQLAAIVD